MIRRVSFTNYKSLAAVDVPLERFTVLVGPNGCGKSSVLDGLHTLTQIAGPRRDGWPGYLFTGSHDPSRIRTRGIDGSMSMSLVLDVPATVKVDVDLGGGFAISTTSTTRQSERSASIAPFAPRPPEDELRKLFAGIEFRGLASAIRLRLDCNKLAAPSYAEQEFPRVEYDGEGLASVLAWLAGAQRERLDTIVESLRHIVPAVRGIRTHRAEVIRTETELIRLNDESIPHRTQRRVWGHRFELDMATIGPIEPDLLSSGTLLALGLLTVLNVSDSPRLLLLDDLETGLHPRAQVELVRLIREIMRTRPHLQVVTTSHSPFVIDEFDVNEVVTMDLGEDHLSRAARLDQHSDWSRWCDLMTTGEFWSNVGETWVGKTAKQQSDKAE